MKILTISTLYPNNIDHKHGIFVENRLRKLRERHPAIESVVIAPVPWLPSFIKGIEEYEKYRGISKEETRNGIKIYHPRYLVVPKIGMLLTPFFMAISLVLAVRQLKKDGFVFDLIDGHYFYPDGVAIAIAHIFLKIPFVCTARGTDINLIPKQYLPKKLIQYVFRKSEHLMAVCQALKDEMVAIGADENKITVLRNGIDLEKFKFSDDNEQSKLKDKYGLTGKVILSVGGLVERKGHYLVIEAIASIEGATLIIIGDGVDLKDLKQQVTDLKLEERVIFTGALQQEALIEYYGLADAMVLASSREGWANVLLESMSCGSPVVATKVWGTPEVVTSRDAGILVDRSVESIRSAIVDIFDTPRSRVSTRSHAEKFTWDSTSDGQFEIFKDKINNKYS
ncbi:glycosyltransferase family 4 protein [Neptunomonas antarctica]|uniref:Glycosyltransferase involved in cell wall bisynthesis n=1 Tax=Neptunomonas antarctica TaxID=619304 RepID=A0A1N7JE80_9GAMM|nr:glycosyltransferase family 4 protein [Neptunomonas antarctica]SIS47655.1 Glycosyltransferase involved in cell wall bisynthesis [Neptunomonas antarctica]